MADLVDHLGLQLLERRNCSGQGHRKPNDLSTTAAAGPCNPLTRCRYLRTAAFAY